MIGFDAGELTQEAKATLAQFDRDLAAMQEQNRKLLAQVANAMLSNAAPEPRLVALEDAPRLDLPRVRRAPAKRVNAKTWRHRNNAEYFEASGFLSPAKRIS